MVNRDGEITETAESTPGWSTEKKAECFSNNEKVKHLKTVVLQRLRNPSSVRQDSFEFNKNTSKYRQESIAIGNKESKFTPIGQFSKHCVNLIKKIPELNSLRKYAELFDKTTVMTL